MLIKIILITITIINVILTFINNKNLNIINNINFIKNIYLFLL